MSKWLTGTSASRRAWRWNVQFDVGEFAPFNVPGNIAGGSLNGIPTEPRSFVAEKLLARLFLKIGGTGHAIGWLVRHFDFSLRSITSISFNFLSVPGSPSRFALRNQYFALGTSRSSKEALIN